MCRRRRGGPWKLFLLSNSINNKDDSANACPTTVLAVAVSSSSRGRTITWTRQKVLHTVWACHLISVLENMSSGRPFGWVPISSFTLRHVFYDSLFASPHRPTTSCKSSQELSPWTTTRFINSIVFLSHSPFALAEQILLGPTCIVSKYRCADRAERPTTMEKVAQLLNVYTAQDSQ